MKLFQRRLADLEDIGVELQVAMLCPICDEERLKFHRHHIVYAPPKIASICSQCHEEITYRNTILAKKLRRELRNEERRTVWNNFVAHESEIFHFEEIIGIKEDNVVIRHTVMYSDPPRIKIDKYATEEDLCPE